MKTTLYSALVCLVLVMLAGCQLGASPAAVTSPTLEQPDSTSLIQSGDLRIGPLDMLKVSVFGVSDLNGDYQVDHLGRIKLPLIGEVSAKGYTAIELSAILENKLEESYLQDPDVSVIVQESLGEQMTIEGSVNKPGMYPLQGQITLLQAVAIGGGPSPDANPKRVIVFRKIEGQRKAAAFDLTAIRKGDAEDPAIFGNDVIVMDGSEARRTYGDVIKSIPLLTFLLVF